MSDDLAVGSFRRTGFERIVRFRHLIGGFSDCALDAGVAVLEIGGERILSIEGCGGEQSSHHSQGPDAIHLGLLGQLDFLPKYTPGRRAEPTSSWRLPRL